MFTLYVYYYMVYYYYWYIISPISQKVSHVFKIAITFSVDYIDLLLYQWAYILQMPHKGQVSQRHYDGLGK